MSQPKFIQEKAWRSSWPEDISEVVENSPLPDVPWKGQIARYRRVFQAMAGLGGVSSSLPEIEDLIQKMNRWSDRHSVYFSWPPTMDGWNRAVWATLSEPQGKDDMAWLLAGYGPSLRMALSQKPRPASWATTFQAAIAPAIVKDEVKLPNEAPTSAPESAPPDPVKASVKKDAVPRRDAPAPVRAKFEESKEVLGARQWIQGLLRDFRAQSLPQGLMVENFDKEIKRRIGDSEYTGQKREAAWLEYEFLPAAAGLALDDMKMLAGLWSDSHSRSFIDPQKTLEGKRFWAQIEGIDGSARGFFVDTLLPTVIDSSEWSSGVRFRLAKEMFAWTKAKPQLFDERLGLWLAWGGRMDDAEPAQAAEGNRFSKATTTPETVADWLRSSGIPAWSAAADNNSRPSRNTPRVG